MNISYREAFIGKRRFDSPRSSEWIFVSKANDDNSKYEWTPEFIEAAKSNGVRIDTSRVWPDKQIVVRPESRLVRCDKGGSFQPDEPYNAAGVIFHYNKETNVMAYTMSGSKVSDVQEVLSFLDTVEWKDEEVYTY